MARKAAFTISPTTDEPWVGLADGKELANWGHGDEVVYNQGNRQVEKHRFFINTFDFLKDNRINGDYFEFGCHRCRTFRMALTEARRHNLEQMKFFAFDSFEGLPQPHSETSVEIWERGALCTPVEQFMELVHVHGIYVDNIITVKGFYDDSLTPQLQRELIESGRKISLTTVDCDLYESAVPVFNFIDPLLQEGAVIYIDDMFAGYKGSPEKGVLKAFREFRTRSRFKFIPHMQIGWWGRSYIAYQASSEAREAL